MVLSSQVADLYVLLRANTSAFKKGMSDEDEEAAETKRTVEHRADETVSAPREKVSKG